MSLAITAVTMPKWGIEMTEGVVTAWRLAVGETVAKGEPLLDVETEKIVNQVDSPGAGVLRRILANVGETRAVGALIGVIAAADTADAEIDRFVTGFRGASVSFTAAAAPSGAPPQESPAEPEQRVSPMARRLAERAGIDISRVHGSGRNGRVSKEDVEAYLAARESTVAAPAAQRVRLSPTRLTIARRLTAAAQSIPHIRLDIDVQMDALRSRREALRDAGVTVNDLLLRACALALLEHPEINAQLDGDDVLQFAHADIALAVATPAGLLTPIVRQADTKPLAALAAECAALIERARSGALSREEITGGSFTVSNLGMYGIRRFDAIINPPQVAILAVGGIEPRVIARDGGVATAHMATLTLAADHRVIDGAAAARFLNRLRNLLEDAGALQ